MPCYHPLKGFILGNNPETGKKVLKITSYKVDHVERKQDGKLYTVETPDIKYSIDTIRNYVDIPCGRCIGCRLSNAKQKSDRASLELQYHKYNYFLTITYDDMHIPTNPIPDLETGEVTGEAYTLRKKDLQNFWKRFRKAIEPNKIKYMACGEYGSISMRSHYHAIVFMDTPIPDLKHYCKTKNGYHLYTSDFLQKIWSINEHTKDELNRPIGSLGQIWIGEATYESIGYVARYVTKKLYGSESVVYDSLNITPEFYTCSTKPALGREYYEENKEKLFRESKYFIPDRNGSHSACPSRYFNNLFESDFDPQLVEDRKNALKRQFESSMAIKLNNTSKDLLDYLEVEEYNKIDQIKSLKRDSI